MWMPGLRKAGLICGPRIWLCGKSVLRRWRGADRIFAVVGRRLLLSRGISMTTFALARLWAGSSIMSKMGTGLSMGIGLSEARANHPTPRAGARDFPGCSKTHKKEGKPPHSKGGRKGTPLLYTVKCLRRLVY